jgi:hemerythrin
MSLLNWSDALTLQHPEMDLTHQEFVALLQGVEAALTGPTEALLASYDEMVAHTAEHFAREDRWMLATGFSPQNCHSGQHSQVLGVLREVGRLAREEGKPETIGHLLPELARWFEHHAQVVDAGLAQHLDSVGFDVATGQVVRPPQAELSGCGSATCSS